MDNNKKTGFEGEEIPEEVDNPDNAPRARNRTVMLTPEITGEVRARLAQEMQAGPAATAAPGFGSLNPQPADPEPEQGFGSGYSPANKSQSASENIMSTRPTAAHMSSAPETYPAPPPPTPTPPSTPTAPSAPAQPAPRPAYGSDRVVWTSASPIRGFLVSYDRDPNGEIFALRRGRIIVTSEAASSGNFLILNDQTVSPMHAILRISTHGDIQVLDQLSEHGTVIKRFGETKEEMLSGEKSTIDHGDLIKFGARQFHVCVVALDDRV